MSATRGSTNQCLYLARVLLDGWAKALAEQEVAEATLTEAYLPGVREHLLRAYGWFLLETAGHEDWNAALPRKAADLPAVAQGKAVSGEVREFTALEAQGWLCDLLADVNFSRSSASSRSRARNNLAVVADATPTQEDAAHWHAELGAVVNRMRDSFDEY